VSSALALTSAQPEQITSLDDLQWAVLEGKGKISFIPRSSDG
jgi:uncharacterized membrane protein YcaP (DUF421 family)